jgi:hypothetical protein
MPGEDPEAYEELRRGMHDSFLPATDPERVLVDQIAANSWRLMRAQRVEAAFLSKLSEGSDDPHMAIATAMFERPQELARIGRYVTAASNAYYKALHELFKMQKERALAEEQAAVARACAEANGFVSKRSPRTSSPASPEVVPAVSAPVEAASGMPVPYDAPSSLRLTA